MTQVPQQPPPQPSQQPRMHRPLKPNTFFIGMTLVIGVAFAQITPPPSPGFFGFILHLLHWLVQVGGLILTLIAVQFCLNRIPWRLWRFAWFRCAVTGFVAPWLFAPIGMLTDIVLGGEGLPNNWWPAYFDEIGGMTPPVVVVWLGLQTPFLLGYQLMPHRINTSDTSANSNRPNSGCTLSEKGTVIASDTVSKNDAVTASDRVIASDLLSQGLSLDSPPGSALDPQTQKTDFFSALPYPVDDILALSSELHYVAVMTSSSSTLLLGSLKSAISELNVDGVQCHRSHWVRLSAITSFQQQGRQGQVMLCNQQVIPVSRSKMMQVQQAMDQSKRSVT